MDRMLDDWTREQGIKHLDQRITTTAKGGIHDVTKGAQALKGFCFHALSMPKRAFRVYSPFASSLLLVTWQDKDLYCIPITSLPRESDPPCSPRAQHAQTATR